MNPEIKVGARCPYFTLVNQKGEEVPFSEALNRARHTALVFYRGHW